MGSMCLTGFSVTRPTHSGRLISETRSHPGVRRLVETERENKDRKLKNLYDYFLLTHGQK